MDKHKLILPISILLGCIIIGGFFYAIQINKQESIERQERRKLEQEKIIEDAKVEQSKKEFVAKRKVDCLDIYESEGKKWNNVRGWRYVEEEDLCYIRYRDPKPKSDSDCDKIYSLENNKSLVWLNLNLLCKDGEFENAF